MTDCPTPTQLHAPIGDDAGFSVTLPAKKNLLLMTLLALWLILWAGGLIAVGRAVFGGALGAVNVFVIFIILAWLAGWLLGGGLAIYGLLWMSCGRETIVATPAGLSIERAIRGYRRARSYAPETIRSLRVDEQDGGWTDLLLSLRPFGIGDGRLTFDCATATVNFATGIDRTQAQALLTEIRAALAGTRG